MSLEHICNILNENGLMTWGSWKKRYQRAVSLEPVRREMEFTLPPIEDVTSLLWITRGKVTAIRLDKTPDVWNHKKLVVGGLILMNILRNFLLPEWDKILIDGWNFNSASALRYYVDKFGMRGAYIMSRFFPEYVLSGLRSDNFLIEQPPENNSLWTEKEFYDFLYEKVKTKEWRKKYVPLWHAKYGGKVLEPFGEELAQITTEPDVMVAGVWAGTTLEWILLPILQRYPKSRIVIAEHAKSPLFAQKLWKTLNIKFKNNSPSSIESSFFQHSQLPHMVIGPHYSDINPLLPEVVFQFISNTILYWDWDWQSVSSALHEKNVSVGNSSAANLSCAWKIAEEFDQHVLTVIYEPDRSFYHSKSQEEWVIQMD